MIYLPPRNSVVKVSHSPLRPTDDPRDMDLPGASHDIEGASQEDDVAADLCLGRARSKHCALFPHWR